ncbi:MAG: nickel-dependent lactate racemase [Chloroflexi bacterium]|nr:MAG: nickel-dependent lactate racemase [Chloroflexota bacterium]
MSPGTILNPMTSYTIPYGRASLSCEIPDRCLSELIALAPNPGVDDPALAVSDALDNLLGDVRWADFTDVWSVAVAINDKTRPVPHQHLLPPLLARLEGLGLPPEKITLIIATGTHPPMGEDAYTAVLPQSIIDRYPIICHDTDDTDSLVNLGETSRGTPVWINRQYVDADLRIVVGNIEPHQFQGFSGGVKSASIGLAGRATVNHNHAMMTDAKAKLGHYDYNPTRQDVEEMGRMIGVHIALNAILNDKKAIVKVVAGVPTAVMATGIPLAKSICQADVPGQYDLVIASPGGHPKDINVYQTQKGLAHATLVTKPGGTVILVAACPEGTGSRGYERWVKERQSNEDVLAQFAQEGFRVGPHKAFQIARDATRVNVLLVSDMEPDFVRQLLLKPVMSLQDAVNTAVSKLPPSARIGVMPKANATIPLLKDS